MELMISIISSFVGGLVSAWRIWVPLIILIIIAAVLKKFIPRLHGIIGEKTVASFLSALDPKKYLIINDLIIENEGKTSQIDHVVISNYGVFVIETKNYDGWIIGDESSNYWTQVIYKRKGKFYNPIKQNYGHIMSLKNHLKEFPDIVYYPIVVFTKRATLKISTKKDVAIYNADLKETIKKQQNEVIPDSLKDIIYTRLNSLNIKDRNLRQKHVQTNIEREENTENKISNDICSKCGGSLILRNGKYGNFKGCSNYPNCKFTVKI